MTAFASIIIAALPGLGAKSGADSAVTADGQAMAGQASGGVFETLMATLTGAAPAQPDARAAAAISMPVPTAAAVGANFGTPNALLPGSTSEEAVALSPVLADNTSLENAAAEALAAAGAVVVAPTPAASKTSATADGESVVPAAAPSPRAVTDTSVEADDPGVPVAATSTAGSAADVALSADMPTRVADVAGRGSPSASAAPATAPVPLPATPPAMAADASVDTVAAHAAPEAVADAPVAPPPTTPAPRSASAAPTTAPVPLPATPAVMAAGASVDTAAARPAPEAVADLPVAPPTIAAPRSATEAVTSLVGRILDGARKLETEAAVRQAAADAAPPVEASADGVVDTPVELAVDTALSPDAPVPGEAAVVEAPVVPASASSRRAARADAARVDVSGETAAPAAPDLKPDARPTANAAPAPLVRPEPSLAPVPVADTGAAPDQATLDATPAAPTLQAAAEAPPETAPTRGSPETVARLASDIARKLEGRTTRFDVQLDPLGLGKVDVSIEINADGRLSASLSFDSAQTAADLRGRAAELRQALEKAGFDLADGGLSFDMNNPGGSTGRETRETLAAWSSRAFQTARSGLEQADVLAARSPSSRTPSGGVDIRI
ncbi:MAG: flagellar hook-length control protein FliK [Caulobacter sp.]|nr:flagellar hook-length control protein FliK [Caulobacter sp.]